jgi:hypothetical protein
MIPLLLADYRVLHATRQARILHQSEYITQSAIIQFTPLFMSDHLGIIPLNESSNNLVPTRNSLNHNILSNFMNEGQKWI